MCTNENPTENDNRPFQYTRTTTDINMVLDQPETENTHSQISTQTNQQTSDTSTNRQNQDTNTFNVDYQNYKYHKFSNPSTRSRY